MNVNGTKLKASDVVYIADKSFAHYGDNTIRTFDEIHLKSKIKLEQIEDYDNLIQRFWFMFNGNYCSAYWLNATLCKDIAHNPKECKHCDFLNKGCVK